MSAEFYRAIREAKTDEERNAIADDYLGAFTSFIASTKRDQIWACLVELAGASDTESMRAQWAVFWKDRERAREFRFCGELGFGGKFWFTPPNLHVSCYREDETPERLRIIEATDKKLAEIVA